MFGSLNIIKYSMFTAFFLLNWNIELDISLIQLKVFLDEAKKEYWKIDSRWPTWMNQLNYAFSKSPAI